PEDTERGDQALPRRGGDRRADRFDARGRDRLSSGADRARKRVPERDDPRDEARGDPRQVQRDRRVPGARAIHRYARQAVFEWHEPAPRLLGGGASRYRCAAGRRGAGGWRQRISAALHGEDARTHELGTDDPLREPQHGGGRESVRPVPGAGWWSNRHDRPGRGSDPSLSGGPASPGPVAPRKSAPP